MGSNPTDLDVAICDALDAINTWLDRRQRDPSLPHPEFPSYIRHHPRYRARVARSDYLQSVSPSDLDQAIHRGLRNLARMDRELALRVQADSRYQREMYSPSPPLLRRQPPMHPDNLERFRREMHGLGSFLPDDVEEKTQDLIIDQPSEESDSGLAPDPSTSDLS